MYTPARCSHALLDGQKGSRERGGPGDKDQVVSRLHLHKQRGETRLQTTFGAVAHHAVPDLFGYGKTDLDLVLSVPGRHQYEASATDLTAGPIRESKLLMPFQGVRPIQKPINTFP